MAAAKRKKAWDNKKGLGIARTLKTKARKSLAAAADWAARNQVRHYWPKWDANAGRLIYHVYLPTDDYMLSTSWNTARTVQGLLAAYKILGNKEYLATAERAIEYILTLQDFRPEHSDMRGTFIEETPLGDHAGPRDSIECTQALMAHYHLTGNKRSLLRAGEFLDWLLNRVENDGWIFAYHFFATGREQGPGNYLSAMNNSAGAIPFTQYAAVTGKKKYVTRGALPMVDFVIKNIQKADGSLQMPKPDSNHHTPLPDDPTVYNDDGAGISILCAWRATGRKKYLDAATAYGEWWLNQEPAELPKLYGLPPASMLFISDMARITNDSRYVDYLSALSKILLDRQVLRDARPLVAGGFIGEDMVAGYRAGADAGDFICLRVISYALIALAKLAAGNARQWTPAYSAFGF